MHLDDTVGTIIYFLDLLDLLVFLMDPWTSCYQTLLPHINENEYTALFILALYIATTYSSKTTVFLHVQQFNPGYWRQVQVVKGSHGRTLRLLHLFRIFQLCEYSLNPFKTRYSRNYIRSTLQEQDLHVYKDFSKILNNFLKIPTPERQTLDRMIGYFLHGGNFVASLTALPLPFSENREGNPSMTTSISNHKPFY